MSLLLAGRSLRLDVLRGAAVLAMVIYHTAWDLSQLQLIETDITAALSWNLFARAIAASFLVLVGASLVVAMRRGFDRRTFGRRLARVGLAAGAVTAVTAVVFPQSYIFFGILHNIAVSSVLALPFVRAPALVSALAGAAALAAPWLVAHPVFDIPALVFVGLGSRAPNTNDFVPLLPWTGFVLGGIALARLAPRLLVGPPEPARPPGRLARGLAFLGRHSLALYLLHQPVIFGALSGLAALAGPNEAAVARPFLQHCLASCREAGQPDATCRAGCGCTIDRFKAEGLWTAAIAGRPDPTQVERMSAIAGACYAAAAEPAAKTPR